MLKALLQGTVDLPAQHVLKAYYFTFFGALVCLFPYFNVYFQYKGFSEHQIGVLSTVRPWVAAVAGNTLSAVADACNCHRVVFLVGYVLSVVLRCALSAVDSYAAALALVILSSIASEPSSVLADTAAMSLAVTEDDFGRARLYGAISWGSISPFAGLLIDHAGVHAAFYAYGTMAVLCLLPALCMNMSNVRGSGQGGRGKGQHGDAAGQKVHYSHRTKGSDIQLVDHMDPEESRCLVADVSHSTYAAADDDYGGGAVDGDGDGAVDGDGAAHDEEEEDAAAVGGASRHDVSRHDVPKHDVPKRRLPKSDVPKHDVQPPHLWRTLWTLMTVDMLIFMAMALTMGIGVGTMDGYLFLLLQQHGASGLLMGLSLTVACMAEIPLFHYSGALLRTLGVDVMLHLVLCAFVLRLLAYSCVPWYPSVWLVLPVEVLHAATFACAWSAGLWKSRLLAPPGAEATTQAIFQGLYMGLGHGIGGLMGGFVYGAAGLQAVFVVATIVIASSWGCIGAMQAWRGVRLRQRWAGGLVDVTDDDVELVGVGAGGCD